MDRKFIGLGIALGVALGAAVGAAIHNLAIGVASGTSLGVAVGVAIGAKAEAIVDRILSFKRMLEHQLSEPRTQLEGNLATLCIVAGVLTLAAGCFSLW